VLYKSLGLKKMKAMHQPEQAVYGPTDSSSLQGYPDENEESLQPRNLGVGKWQLYGRAVETVQTAPTPGRWFKKLYFNQDGIKRGGVA
jgi:hypothetical protein